MRVLNRIKIPYTDRTHSAKRNCTFSVAHFRLDFTTIRSFTHELYFAHFNSIYFIYNQFLLHQSLVPPSTTTNAELSDMPVVTTDYLVFVTVMSSLMISVYIQDDDNSHNFSAALRSWCRLFRASFSFVFENSSPVTCCMCILLVCFPS